jgi:polyisoprenyl-teichoic acid--peptidoglycan teichoic acid transferase
VKWVNWQKGMDRLQLNQGRRRPTLDRLGLGLLIGLAVLIISTIVVGVIVVRNLVASWNGTNVTANGTVTAKSGTALPGIEPTLDSKLYSAPLQAKGMPTAPPWDGNSRINILVMGLDYRDWQDNPDTPSRTDSMMLFTIDPVNKTAGMLSVPRDLWVQIPGFDFAKINQAYYLGAANKLPGGGPALAVKTVEQVLNVPIQYYAQIDFDAFAKMIDELGGIDVYVHETMRVSLVGKAGSFELKPGVQTLDGPTLLAYVRNRYTDGNDFARSQRQQEVIMTIRDEILQLNMLPTLIAKAPALYQELASGIHTNLNLDQIIRLAVLAESLDRARIHQVVIDSNDVMDTYSSDGQAILIPIPDRIRIRRDELFADTAGPASIIPPTQAAGDPAKLMKSENARIAVRNGTATSGLANNTADYFKKQGLDVVDQSNADQSYETSLIYVYTSKPYTVRYLADLMKVPDSRIFNKFNPDSKFDVEVILGLDWAYKNPLP